MDRSIRIKVVLKQPYNQWFIQHEYSIEIPFGSTVGSAFEALIKREGMQDLLVAKGAFVSGKLRALYTVNGTAEKANFTLHDNDILQVIGLFIGG